MKGEKKTTMAICAEESSMVSKWQTTYKMSSRVSGRGIQQKG